MTDNTTNKNNTENKIIPEQLKGIDYNLILFFNNFATREDLKIIRDEIQILRNDIDKKFKILYWIIGIAFTGGFGVLFNMLNTILSKLH